MDKKKIVKVAQELYCENEDGVYLINGVCDNCGFKMFPVQKYCPQCLAEEIKKELLPNEGIIYSYTTIYAAPAGFIAPYSVCNADIGEFRIYGMLVGENPFIGAKIKLELGTIRESEDTIYMGYKYKMEERCKEI